MHIPRRGEVATYVAKLFDVPFGSEQWRIRHLKEGKSHAETANTVAKLLVKRINRLLCPDDDTSPADEIENKLPGLSYRLLANAADGASLEFLWRDAAKFFEHHAEIVSRTREVPRGKASQASLDLDIYLYFFVLPVFANNLMKYEAMGRMLVLPELSIARGYWFLPSVVSGREDCITPMANALTWLRGKLGGQNALQRFLCPKSEPDNAARELDKWRCGDIVPGAESITEWAKRFEGDRREFRIVFHLCAATTRAWRHMRKAFGYPQAIALNNHLLNLVESLRQAREISTGSRPDFNGQSSEMKRCLGWLYSGPQVGPLTLGVNYGGLLAEMQAAFISGHSPFSLSSSSTKR